MKTRSLVIWGGSGIFISRRVTGERAAKEAAQALRKTPHPITPFPSSLSPGEREEGEGSWVRGHFCATSIHFLLSTPNFRFPAQPPIP